MIRASCPGKLVVAGAFAVLDGAPGLAVAVSPRLALDLAPGAWPSDDPFAREALRAAGGDPARPPDLCPLGAFPVAVEGFSLGSSAAYATSLVAALSAGGPRPLSGEALFRAARAAHRAAQGGEGSGLDVAACALGGAVLVRDAAGDGDPRVLRLPWPSWLEVVVVRAGVAGRTPDRIRRWRQAPSGARPDLRAAVERAVEALGNALAGGDAAILEALSQTGAREAEWLSATAPDLACPAVPAVQAAVADLGAAVAVRSLGAGDAAGVFLDARRVDVSAVQARLAPTGLPSLAVKADPAGCTLEML